MAYRVVVDPKVCDDLHDIHAHIERENPRAANELIDQLETAFQSLSTMPARFALRPDIRPSYHVFTVGKYLIFYRVTHDTVQVARVIHGARDIGAAFDE